MNERTRAGHDRAMLHRFFIVLAFFLFSMPALAMADPPPRRVVVLELKPGAADLDAAHLRTSIGADLGAGVVTPDDPRATTANGSISIDVIEGKIVVVYAPRAVTRSFPAPVAPEARARAVVVVAENAARDEAKDVIAGLEKMPEPREPPPAEQPPPKPEGHIEYFALRLWSDTRSFTNVGFRAGIIPAREGATAGWFVGAGFGLTGPSGPTQMAGSLDLGFFHRMADRLYLTAGVALTAEGDVNRKNAGVFATWFQAGVLWQASRFFGPYAQLGLGDLARGGTDNRTALEAVLGLQICITRC
jgi:hypothetical protein